MIKFSLIIPVYNTERFLQKCIESCENQDIPRSEYEVIAVNDGSTDGSLNLLKYLATIYSNIIIITQNNKGLSAARNEGVKIASGKYIWFIDSDDWIESSILGILYLKLSHKQLECLIIGYKMVWESLHREVKCVCTTLDVQTGEQIVGNNMRLPLYAWNFIFNREYWVSNFFVFKEGLIFEDLQLIPKVILKAIRVGQYYSCAYNYRQRNNSLVHTVNEKMLRSLFDILLDYDRLLSSFSSHGICEYIDYLYSKIQIMYIVLLGNISDEQVKNRYRRIFTLKYSKIRYSRSLNLKEKLVVALYNKFPYILFIMLKLKKKFKDANFDSRIFII